MLASGLKNLPGQRLLPTIFPEARSISYRDPSQLRRARIPDVARPVTVRNRQERKEHQITLDDAIRIAIDNANVVRILSGVTATNSGRTIYDPAISNTRIDEANAVFDPKVRGEHNFDRNERPVLLETPPPLIGRSSTAKYENFTQIEKPTITGGLARFRVEAGRDRLRRIPLANSNTSSLARFSFTQPLLQGGGIAFNLSPIVIARIDTERSFFQLKDSLQLMVVGVIQAYWNLVQARLDVWTLENQIQQTRFANKRAIAALNSGLATGADRSQASLAQANFEANLIAAEARLLDQEAALRSILGLPPSSAEEFVPTTPPTALASDFEWEGLLVVAEEQRPDIIELKLVLEADEQMLLQARNNAQPSVNAEMLYQWNGIEGEIPGGPRFDSTADTFADWQLGVNFSVPLGLRQSRAGLRRQELVLARDRVNLDQAMLEVVHTLSASVRNLDQSFAQYEAFKIARKSAEKNLQQIQAEYTAGTIQLINLLDAIVSWGNAVSSEAGALTRYNIELANLERETGTVLSVHGITLFEERYCSLGPLGRLGKGRCYPKSLPPVGEPSRYPSGETPSEEFFDLTPPTKQRMEFIPPEPRPGRR